MESCTFHLSSKNQKSPPGENFLCFWKQNPRKVSYVLGKRKPEKVINILEVTCKA